MLRRKLFYKKDLPVKFTALSRCYRPEVSQSAHEARLYRVHEFTKVFLENILVVFSSAYRLLFF